MKSFVGVVASAGLATLVYPIAARADYPERPIRMVIPYVPGGGTSFVAKLVAQRLTDRWGQNVILDHRGGAGGILGAETVARAQPDGYTVMFTSVSAHLLAALLQKTSYDAIESFVPVATVGITERIMVVNAALPVNSVKDLITLARTKPGQVIYASLGNGSTSHVGTEVFCLRAGVKMTHVPYKGGAQAVTDLVAGQVQVYLGSLVSMGGFIQAGRLRPLAITGKSRAAALPQVPTFAEAGLPGVEISMWYGVLAPSRTSAAIVNKLGAEIEQFVRSAEFGERVASLGIAPYSVPQEKIEALMRADTRRDAEVIRAAGITAN